VGALGAIQALGRIGGSTAIESLKAAIQETNSTERAYAVRALGKAGRSDALGEIISYLHDPSVGVRESAVYALEEIGDPRALPELELLANSDTALVDRFGPSVGELANNAIKKIRKRTSK
jgi:HEAT repeat protein